MEGNDILRAAQAWEKIQTAAQEVGLPPEFLGMLAGKRMTRRMLLGNQTNAILRLASEEFIKGNHDKWPPETLEKTQTRLAEYWADKGELDLAGEIAGGIPENEKLKQRLVWRAGGSEDAPGLKEILKSKGPWMKRASAAAEWRNTNRETTGRRLELIRLKEPDFNPRNKKWGTYLKSRLEEAGISLDQQRKDGEPPPIKGEKEATIIGEEHGNPESTWKICDLLTEAWKTGTRALSAEEPSNGSWKPITELLVACGGNRSLETIIATANALAEDPRAAGRLAALGWGKTLGMKLYFTDQPAEAKRRRSAERKAQARRRVCYGEPLDETRPETALGGIRVLATNLLHDFRDTRKRSLIMAAGITKIPEKKIIHIGGALHAVDTARALEKQGWKTKIEWPRRKENPLADALGLTPKERAPNKEKGHKSLTKSRTRLDIDGI